MPCSAQGELVQYAEVVNNMLVQLLSWSLNVADKDPGHCRPMRYSLSCTIVSCTILCVFVTNQVLCMIATLVG